MAGFLLTISTIALGLLYLDQKKPQLFRFVPAIVIVYALSMLTANLAIFYDPQEVTTLYVTLKNNILPAMLFLMLLQVDLRSFFSLGKTLLIAFFGAFFSIVVSFIVVFHLFDFASRDAGVFAALSGSWLGGTANMLAVGAAYGVDERAMGYAMITDSAAYGFWVMALLSLVPFAERFNRFSGATHIGDRLDGIGCACTIGAKRYWALLGISLFVSLIVQLLALRLPLLSTTTWSVLLATVAGLSGAHTKLKNFNGANDIANTMLYLLVALIGSRAHFSGFAELGGYIGAAFCILAFHAIFMVVLAKIFKLDLFSIGIASLANIGGAASAPVLAASYDKTLVGIAVIMAVMGYLFGTVGGLAVGYILGA